MDKLSVRHRRNKTTKPKMSSKQLKSIKVVYISSPMKLTARAEDFRAIVQELTGRDSNVAVDVDMPIYNTSRQGGRPVVDGSMEASNGLSQQDATTLGYCSSTTDVGMSTASPFMMFEDQAYCYSQEQLYYGSRFGGGFDQF